MQLETQPTSTPTPPSDNEMYTADWFDKNIELWAQVFVKFRDIPVQSLEIGSFEGRSAEWMLKNILIHKDSHMTCLDPHEYDVEARVTGKSAHIEKLHDMKQVHTLFLENMQKWFDKGKLTYHRKSSPDYLKYLPLDHYDTVYIDASHTASAVLTDGVICWGLLKVGGVLVFDDYVWSCNLADKEDPELWRPKMGIDAFLKVFRTRYKLIHKEDQVILQKLS